MSKPSSIKSPQGNRTQSGRASPRLVKRPAGDVQDAYVELFETGKIPGGKSSTDAFRLRLEQDYKVTGGKG